MSLTELSYDLIEILKFPSGSVCPCAPHPFSLIEGDHHKVICIISIFNYSSSLHLQCYNVILMIFILIMIYYVTGMCVQAIGSMN